MVQMVYIIMYAAIVFIMHIILKLPQDSFVRENVQLFGTKAQWAA